MKFTTCSECKTVDFCLDNFYGSAEELKSMEQKNPRQFSLPIRPAEVDFVIDDLVTKQKYEGCEYSAQDIDDIVQGMIGRTVA